MNFTHDITNIHKLTTFIPAVCRSYYDVVEEQKERSF